MPSTKSWVILTLAIAIGYFSYVEFPEACDFPIGMKFFYGLARLSTHLNEFSAWMGGSYVYFFRLIEIDLSPKLDNLEISVEKFNGVRTTIFRPLEDTSEGDLKPAIIFYHGGGWAVGSVELYAAFVKTLAVRSKLTIIFPEYRLAPEHPYPIPLQDCVDATIGFANRAEQFGIDKNKVIFAGDSAGGNLAAAVSLRLARMKDVNIKPCYMNLIYPILQISDFKLPSYLQNPNAPLVFPDQTVKFALHYMGLQNETGLIRPMLHNYHMEGIKSENFAGKISGKWVPEKYKSKNIEVQSYAPTEDELATLRKYKTEIQNRASDIEFAPLSATDDELKLFTRTHIVTSNYDVLRDESIILYERMKKLQMDVTYTNLKFAAHGIWNLLGAFSYDKLDVAAAELIVKLKEGVERC